MPSILVQGGLESPLSTAKPLCSCTCCVSAPATAATTICARTHGSQESPIPTGASNEHEGIGSSYGGVLDGMGGSELAYETQHTPQVLFRHDCNSHFASWGSALFLCIRRSGVQASQNRFLNLNLPRTDKGRYIQA